MHLLDSSAITIIIKRLREDAVEYLVENATLDLSRYELGNIIWKECVLKGLISREEALQRAEDMAKMLEFIKIEKVESDEDFKEALKLAADLKITFYDASYLEIAKARRLSLVTEDKELREKAKKANIRTITVHELLETSQGTNR